MAMELPDEAIVYNYQSLLVPAGEDWTAAAELRARHFLQPSRLKEINPRLMQCRSQIAADREMRNVPAEQLPLDTGFIDLPQITLEQFRRKGDFSDLGRTINLATQLREEVDRIVLLGIGGGYLGARALFEALKPAYHNELPEESRLGVPRIYFEGNNTDNDALQDLLDLIQVSCVDPERREERWGVLVLSESGLALEPAVAQRVFRREAAEYYGLRSPWIQQLFALVSSTGSKLHDLFKAYGDNESNLLTLPEQVGSRYAVFTPAGLLPAALMGLDIRALLLGAAAMTKRFLEDPFERNPVLQFAAVNYLLREELGKSTRVMAVWSKKLEAVGAWYAQLVAGSLGQRGGGPTPLTVVQTRDLHGWGQLNQEGPRDRLVNNLVVKNPQGVPIMVQMADRNEDDLNTYARKSMPDLLNAALRVTNEAGFKAARPMADLVVPTLSEHALGQLLQLLMLATVVEGRLMGINPFASPRSGTYHQELRDVLKG